MQTSIHLVPVAGMELLLPKMTLVGLRRGVKWRNQWQWEHMMHEAPELMSHMSESSLSDRSEWDVNADLTSGEGSMEAQKRWTMLS